MSLQVYENIHSIHHSWKAPIALSAIYSHPVEFLVGNVPTVAAGPLLLGSHITTFWLWAFAAVVGTCLNHCGYQLPFLPGNQIHDYHHSTFVPADGPQNLGVLGCLDHLCGTDKGFLASWQVKLHQRYAETSHPTFSHFLLILLILLILRLLTPTLPRGLGVLACFRHTVQPTLDCCRGN